MVKGLMTSADATFGKNLHDILRADDLVLPPCMLDDYLPWADLAA